MSVCFSPYLTFKFSPLRRGGGTPKFSLLIVFFIFTSLHLWGGNTLRLPKFPAGKGPGFGLFIFFSYLHWFIPTLICLIFSKPYLVKCFFLASYLRLSICRGTSIRRWVPPRLFFLLKKIIRGGQGQNI